MKVGTHSAISEEFPSALCLSLVCKMGLTAVPSPVIVGEERAVPISASPVAGTRVTWQTSTPAIT